MRDNPLSRVCECSICGEQGLTDKTVLPPGWLTMWEYGYTLCDKCVSRWVERYGEEPDYLIKGGEEELLLL